MTGSTEKGEATPGSPQLIEMKSVDRAPEPRGSSDSTLLSIHPRTMEHGRLDDVVQGKVEWRLWGPYLSERQWGTVREDYSRHGEAWDYLTHDAARSRAYRWGEDGIAGVSDDHQRLCLSLALWNGEDAILKERLFGLTNAEGNHGEDVKEYYYYLDATPTHSYLKYLYKYPQREFPYGRLVEENRRRGKAQPEFELIDTGAFDEDRYFDVFIEYAKAGPHDLLMLVTAHNRGPDAAIIHVLPQVWFRNTWSWQANAPRPELSSSNQSTVIARHDALGTYRLHYADSPTLLFCENETNTGRLFGYRTKGHFKDAFHDYVVKRNADAVNPLGKGTKVAAHYQATIAAGGNLAVRVRLTNSQLGAPFQDFDSVMAQRRREADEYFVELQKGISDPDARNVQRQALAGMIWSKQFYHYDVPRWITGDTAQPAPPPERARGRNTEWPHLANADVISMPDKWEYPWYASWDLAFHCIAMSLVDTDFAKQQLVLLTREWYMHPNGQMPAYEWAFGDVNPPVQAWAAWRVFSIDRKLRGDAGDLGFLERLFHKLMLNFTWWVNRKDAQGRNIFQGGFLGLDNIGLFDRSAPLPTGGFINQADGTGWMAMYSLNLLRIALELARHNRVYQDVATKFFEHFLQIASAMTDIAGKGIGLWDDEDEFYYNVLSLPDGDGVVVKVRSLVGLIPLFAVETLEPELLASVPEFGARLQWVLEHRPDLARLVSRWNEPGRGERRLLSLMRGHRLKRVLRCMLDETEFLSEYGVRSLSRNHLDHPYVLSRDGKSFSISYEPAESTSGLFGGNSNWRGPIWFPVNFLIIESLQKFHHYYGDDFKVECPTGSGEFSTLNDVAKELSQRLARIFLRDAGGRRPVFGGTEKFQHDPNWCDLLNFYEYFHGDNGAGIGACHQTGWTGLIAKLLQPRTEPVH